jgi:predicted KAP-like P-loop ATPase
VKESELRPRSSPDSRGSGCSSTFAKAIAEQILASPAVDSYVVALMGPWGCGKTSMVNMIAEEAQLRSEALVVLHFNPWIFSGTEQLVGHFFRELGAQLSEVKQGKFNSVASSIKTYAGGKCQRL